MHDAVRRDHLGEHEAGAEAPHRAPEGAAADAGHGRHEQAAVEAQGADRQGLQQRVAQVVRGVRPGPGAGPSVGLLAAQHELDAAHRELPVDRRDRAAVRRDQHREAAGGDHRGGDAELGADGLGDAVDLAGEAVDGARLHGFGGVAADGAAGLAHVDVDEAGGARGERLHGDLDAGGDGAAHVVAAGVDDVEVGRGAEVDDDHRRAVALEPGHRVGDAVGADLGRVLDHEADAGAHAGPQHERREAEVLLAHRHPLRREARHDRGDGHLVDQLPDALAEQAEEALQQAGDLVGGAVAHGGDAPVVRDDAALAQADDGLRVADVDDEQHGQSDHQAEVDPGRRRGEGAHRDHGDAGRGVGRHGLERDAAGDLEHGAARRAGSRPRAPWRRPCCRAG